MSHHDLLIIGAGSGNTVIGPDHDHLDIAIAEPWAFGGTCMNRGCIPSKMLVHAADLAVAARHAPELGVHMSLLFHVNTDALKYPRSPALALTTADQMEAHFKALAAKASREMAAYNNRGASKKLNGGKVDAFALQRAAIRWKKELPLVRNPGTLRSADRLVTEGALTAVVLAIAAGLEAALAWSLPEWKSTRTSDVPRRRADAVPGTTSRRRRGAP